MQPSIFKYGDYKVYIEDAISSMPRNGRGVKVLESLLFLKEVGLVVEVDGRFEAGRAIVHLDGDSPHVTKHHSHLRLKAIDSAIKIESKLVCPRLSSSGELRTIRKSAERFLSFGVSVTCATGLRPIPALLINCFFTLRVISRAVFTVADADIVSITIFVVCV